MKKISVPLLTVLFAYSGNLTYAQPLLKTEAPPQHQNKKQKTPKNGTPRKIEKSKVNIERGTYHGWKNTVRLSNGETELIFVPQIGRIMRYATIGAPNLLWNNPALLGKTLDLAKPGTDWMNFGGDKLWPAPQSKWGWPPDPVMDAGTQEVKIKDGKTLLVKGKISPKHAVQFTREITMDAQGSTVTLVNTLTNVGKMEETWSCWEVAQMDDPNRMKTVLWKGGKNPKGYYDFPDAAPDEGLIKSDGEFLILERSKTKSAKIGSDSPEGMLISEKGKRQFLMKMKVEAGKSYPDENSPLEIYTNPDPAAYVELEMLSPLNKLKPGESVTFTVTWKIETLEKQPLPSDTPKKEGEKP